MLDVLLDAETAAVSGTGFTYSSTARQALVLLAEAASRGRKSLTAASGRM
jgi:hypothetical protein